MTTLLLARHGETDWNRELRVQGTSDTVLNELGRAQAAELAPARGRGHRRDYASDLSRARDGRDRRRRDGARGPARPRLAGARLRLLGGLDTEEIDARFADHDQHDGETYDEVRARVLAAANRIVAEHPGETVLVVSHGGALNALWHDAVERPGRWGNCAVYGLEFRRAAPRARLTDPVEDYTNKYKGEQIEVALFGGEYQEGVLTAYCSIEDVPHIELNGHILVPAPERRLAPLLEPLRRA